AMLGPPKGMKAEVGSPRDPAPESSLQTQLLNSLDARIIRSAVPVVPMIDSSVTPGAVFGVNVVAPYEKVPPGSGPLDDELLLDVWVSRTVVIAKSKSPETSTSIASPRRIPRNLKRKNPRSVECSRNSSSFSESKKWEGSFCGAVKGNSGA